jgi:hypothetical protein
VAVLGFHVSAAVVHIEFGIRRAAHVQHICEDYLSDSRYERSHVLAGRGHAPILALKPEIGSIEDRSPGVVAELIRIRQSLIENREQIERSGESPLAVRQMFEHYLDQLTSLQFDRSEPRLNRLLQKMISSAASRIQSGTGSTPLKDVVTGFTSKIWELTVACFFAGDEILLNQSLSKLYPEEFKTAMQANGFQRIDGDRELDIVIKKKDGGWRWIEVKDWGRNNTLMNESKKHVRVQSLGQDRARRALGLDVELLLVMKYGTPGLDYLQYRVESNYDDMLFVFPEGIPHHELQ